MRPSPWPTRCHLLALEGQRMHRKASRQALSVRHPQGLSCAATTVGAAHGHPAKDGGIVAPATGQAGSLPSKRRATGDLQWQQQPHSREWPRAAGAATGSWRLVEKGPYFKSWQRAGRRGNRDGTEQRPATSPGRQSQATHPEILLGQDTPRRKHTSARVWPIQSHRWPQAPGRGGAFWPLRGSST